MKAAALDATICHVCEMTFRTGDTVVFRAEVKLEKGVLNLQQIHLRCA